VPENSSAVREKTSRDGYNLGIRYLPTWSGHFWFTPGNLSVLITANNLDAVPSNSAHTSDANSDVLTNYVQIRSLARVWKPQVADGGRAGWESANEEH